MFLRMLFVASLAISVTLLSTTDAAASRVAGRGKASVLGDQRFAVIAVLTQRDTDRARVAPMQPAAAAKKPRPGVSRSARIATDSGEKSAATIGLSPARNVARATAPVVTVASTGAGQAGYVHYFIIQQPDGDEETQVGIELPDQRIAWSFPRLGVVVSPFIVAGSVMANGQFYAVQHLYGIRPFPDDGSMRALQARLEARVIPWVEDATPYCNTRLPRGEFYMSCLGFALRILFPAPTPAYPALPRDFRRAAPGSHYTTEDLLLYLVGLHGVRTKQARLRRVDELLLPDNLREEVTRLVNAADANDNVAAADAVAPPAPAARNRAGARPSSKSGPQRAPQRKGST